MQRQAGRQENVEVEGLIVHKKQEQKTGHRETRQEHTNTNNDLTLDKGNTKTKYTD